MKKYLHSLLQSDNEETWHVKRTPVVQMPCMWQTISWWKPYRCHRIVAGIFRAETDIRSTGGEIRMLAAHHQTQAWCIYTSGRGGIAEQGGRDDGHHLLGPQVWVYAVQGRTLWQGPALVFCLEVLLPSRAPLRFIDGAKVQTVFHTTESPTKNSLIIVH